MIARTWFDMHYAVLLLLTTLTTIDAYIWMGPDVAGREISATICGFVSALLWLVAASMFEKAGSLTARRNRANQGSNRSLVARP